MSKCYIVHLVHDATTYNSKCILIDVTTCTDRQVFDFMCNLSPTKQVMYCPGYSKYVACIPSVAHPSVFEPYYNPETGEGHEFFLRYAD